MGRVAPAASIAIVWTDSLVMDGVVDVVMVVVDVAIAVDVLLGKLT